VPAREREREKEGGGGHLGAEKLEPEVLALGVGNHLVGEMPQVLVLLGQFLTGHIHD
jgi:hypothetical protein